MAKVLIRAAFRKRPNAESILLEKLKSEKDQETLSDILQILGGMNSPKAHSLTSDFLSYDNMRCKEVALFVLGWIGGKKDIKTLNTHMLYEKASLLRTTAASAHRQIAWRDETLRSDVLNSLKIGFENEKEEEVLKWIIVMISTVADKKLGLREDKDNPDVLHGDLEQAKKKTKIFLEKLNVR